jgi:hypothetical protein
MIKEKINELNEEIEIEEIEIEKVTFTEWWALMEERELPKQITKSDFRALYCGYWNWCWFRMVEPETMEEVQQWIQQ